MRDEGEGRIVNVTVCQGCARSVPDAYLCTDCADNLRERLYSVDQLVDDLEIALCRMTRARLDQAGIRVRGAGSTPLAFNAAASEALSLLHGTLHTWAVAVARANSSRLILPRNLVPVDARDPAHIAHARGRIAGLAAWLAERLDWVRVHPAVGVLRAEIGYAIDTGHATIDRAVDLDYAGPCGKELRDGTCRADLYAPRNADRVTCRRCNAVHDMAARHRWLLAAARDQLVSAPDASRTLSALLGKPVTAAMIRGYAHRRRLTQHTGPGRGPLYRLGDIVDVVVAVEAEQASKRGRKTG
jgi:hypothetical protein